MLMACRSFHVRFWLTLVVRVFAHALDTAARRRYVHIFSNRLDDSAVSGGVDIFSNLLDDFRRYVGLTSFPTVSN